MANNDEDIIIQEGYFSLAGNLLTKLLTGNSLYLIYFSQHLYKQLTEIETELPENYIYIFIGSVIIFTNLSNLCSNYFFSGVNIRLIILITYLFLLTAHSLIYYSSYIPFIITAFVLYGIGNGISYYPLILNSARFFPQYKNIISLLNLFIYCLSPLLFHFISNKIISNNPETGVKKTIKLEIILYLIFGTLSFIFTFDSYELITKSRTRLNEKIMLSGEIPIQRINTINKEEESSTGESQRNSLVSGTSVNTQNTNIHNLISRNAISNEEDKIRKFSKNLKNVIKSKNFITINLFYFFTLLGTFGLFFEIKNNISIYLLMIALFRFISPFMANIFSGKLLSGFCLFFQLGILYVAANSVHYTESQINLIVLISGICYGINSTIISSIIPKIYGYDLSYYLSGIIIVCGCSSYCFVYLINSYFKEKKRLFLYEICTIIAIVFLFLIKETAFDFKIRGNEEINDNELQDEQKNYDAYSINDVKSERDI